MIVGSRPEPIVNSIDVNIIQMKACGNSKCDKFMGNDPDNRKNVVESAPIRM